VETREGEGGNTEETRDELNVPESTGKAFSTRGPRAPERRSPPYLLTIPAISFKSST
jgi:hypothetical protein